MLLRRELTLNNSRVPSSLRFPHINMLPLGDFHTHISRAQIRGSAKRRNGRWVSTGGVIARSPGAYNNRQSSDRSHWSAGKSTSQVYLPHSESNASGQYGIVKRTSSRRASKAAAARRQPTFRRTRGVSSLAQRSTILEADTRQRPLPKFRELSGHGEQAESLGEQPQGHASGMLPMKFRNPATLEAADSRMDVPAPTLARLTDLRTKMRPEKTKYFIGSGPEEQEYRRISQAVMTSLTRLLASLRYAIDSDIGHIYQTELVISKLGLRLSKPLLNTAIHIAQRYIHSCVTWDSFQRGHHRQSPIGRLQVLHDLRQQDRHSVERAFNCSWNEVYIGSLLLQKYQELTGRLSRRAARRVYYTFIAPLTHTHQEIMTMLMLGYKEYKDASKIERAITQLYKSLSSICGAVGKILYSRPLTPSGRYRYSELHPYALFSLLRHFKMSSQELKAHIGDLRILRANLGALSDAERRASRQGEGLNLQYWNLTETQTQQNGLPAYLEYEGKGDNSLGLNDSKIQPRLSLGGLPPSEEADRHQLDARRGLHPKSEGDIRSQVQHASPQIYLSSKGTRKEDFSSSQVKRLPQTTWSKDPQSQSGVYSVDSRTLVRKSRQRVAAYHTSANRESSAAATAALETTNASKTDDNQVCATGATNERQAGSPLGYYIPSDRMRESMLASRSSRSAYWQYTLYRGPKREKVMVHYCKRLETTERISKLFLNESVIGFDIEWKPAATVKDGIRKNVATIQIASEERIALFHIARFSKGDSVEDLVAPSFKQIMESPSITKVGVSVKSDCTRLRKFMNIDSRGLFELSHLYKLVKFASDDVKKINKKLVSLATQVEEHLMLPMYKDENVRASDWSEELDYEQIYCELSVFIFNQAPTDITQTQHQTPTPASNSTTSSTTSAYPSPPPRLSQPTPNSTSPSASQTAKR